MNHKLAILRVLKPVILQFSYKNPWISITYNKFMKYLGIRLCHYFTFFSSFYRQTKYLMSLADLRHHPPRWRLFQEWQPLSSGYLLTISQSLACMTLTKDVTMHTMYFRNDFMTLMVVIVAVSWSCFYLTSKLDFLVIKLF